jgi:PEP-CTERM motif
MRAALRLQILFKRHKDSSGLLICIYGIIFAVIQISGVHNIMTTHPQSFVAALALCAGFAHAASIHDTFSDGSGIIQSDSAPFVEAYLPSGEAPGGGRYIANTIGSGVAQSGKFTFGAIQSGAYFTLADAAIPLYTNLSYGVANGFGADLSLDLRSERAFQLDFRYVTAPTSLTLSVLSANTAGVGGHVANFALSLQPSFAQTVVIPFSALVVDTGSTGPVHWDDVDSISLIASGPGGSGFALDTFSTTPVPEPETWAMLMVGLGAVMGRARKKEKTNPGASA